MTNKIIFEIVPKKGFDYIELVENYNNNKRCVDLSACELKQHVSIVDSFREEFVDYIIKNGMSSLFMRKLLLDCLVAPNTSSSDIQLIFERYLKSLAVSTDLIVVDPYFFSTPKDSSYLTLIENIFQPFLPTLKNLYIITGSGKKLDNTLVAGIKTKLTTKAPSLKVMHKTSNEFHDRFWINPLLKNGLICGTSLNGLGKKYALVDKLQSTDVEDILKALKTENLI